LTIVISAKKNINFKNKTLLGLMINTTIISRPGNILINRDWHDTPGFIRLIELFLASDKQNILLIKLLANDDNFMTSLV